jgi:acetolactate synthase-1/3 small subunit
MHTSQADTSNLNARLNPAVPSSDKGDSTSVRADLERGTVLRLLVRNHPGVMSHVCGLFARRAFNVEGIVCLPIADGTRSIILLVVVEDARLEQVMRQIEKLEDILEVRRAPEAREAITAVSRWLR